MGTFVEDIRYGIRSLFKNRNYALAALLCLGLGIGASTAVFAVFNVVWLGAIPFDQPDRLVSIQDSHVVPGSKPEYYDVSPINFVAFQKRNKSFKFMSVALVENFNLMSNAGEAVRVTGARVSHQFFPLLGIQPMSGRAFRKDEDLPSSPADVVLVGHGLWQRQFGAQPGMLGKTIRINGRNRIVIGIMPPRFQFPLWDEFPTGVDFWIPLGVDADKEPKRKWHYMFAVARLKNGVSFEQAQSDLTNMAEQLQKEYPDINTGWGARLMTLQDRTVGNVKSAFWALIAAVGSLLLLACISVATLLLARSRSKSIELSVRAAVGASSWRLVRQLLIESTLLALLGGALGFVTAAVCLPSIIALSPVDIPHLKNARVDLPMMGFSIMVSLLTCLFFGLLPALRASKTEPGQLLRGQKSGLLGGLIGKKLQSVLVVVLISIMFILLVGGGLLYRSLLKIQQIDPRFDTKNRLTIRMTLSEAQYPELSQRKDFVREVVNNTRSLPGVIAVGASTHLPIGDVPDYATFTIEGHAPSQPGEVYTVRIGGVYPDYFKAMGIDLIKGRVFDSRDHQDSLLVAVISEEMERHYWPGEEAIGRRIERGPKLFTVVGVVEDVKTLGLEGPFEPVWYWSLPQSFLINVSLVFHTASDPLSMLPAIRKKISEIDREQAIYRESTLEDLVLQSISIKRFTVLLIAIFALMGLVISGVALYGAFSYRVNQLHSEIGLRMAVGATPWNVLKSVTLQGARLVLLGIGLGFIVFLGVHRILGSYLHGIEAMDPLTFGSVALFILIVAVLSTYLPALRAARVDPADALRAQ